MRRIFNTELYVKTPTCFDASMHHHHHHHQAVLLLYQSNMPVNMQSKSARTLKVLKAYRYQVGNRVDLTEPPSCMLLKFLVLSQFIYL
jgi:vacuolar-type H+-ATPase catalytic subunit A/Vma1